MSEIDGPRLASVEDVDERSGNLVQNSVRYATSVTASSRKERSNTGRSLRRGARAESSSALTAAAHTDSDSTLHPSLDRRHSTRNSKEGEKPKEKDRERDRRAVVPMQPPPSRRSATTASRGSSRDQEPSYFGVPSPVTMTAAPASLRYARQPRHNIMPPQANTRFYAPPVPAPPPMFPSTWASAGHAMGYPVHPQAMVTPRPLEDRFGVRSTRPKSAMAQKPTRQPSYENAHEGALTVARRGSTSKRPAKIDMAPSRRPGSARPAVSSAFARPSPTPLARKAVGFEEDDSDGGTELFQDISPQPRRTFTPAPPSARSRSRSRRPSVDARSITYDEGTFRTEVAGPSSRRHSYYGQHPAQARGGYEDQLRNAQVYQEDVDGAANLLLTAEVLRKASRHGGSSRSTRSSGSHDESEYRRSATTRTTRSSADNEDVTIRVKGHATLMVGGAEMHCQDGAEINISQRGGACRGGSDESSYLDQDDRRTRIDRALGPPRTRASSQAGSYSRASYSVYDPHANPFGTTPYDVASNYQPRYGYAQVPPYPAYPYTGSYESARGSFF